MELNLNFGNGEIFYLNLKYFRRHFDTMHSRRATSDKEIKRSLSTHNTVLAKLRQFTGKKLASAVISAHMSNCGGRGVVPADRPRASSQMSISPPPRPPRRPWRGEGREGTLTGLITGMGGGRLD